MSTIFSSEYFAAEGGTHLNAEDYGKEDNVNDGIDYGNGDDKISGYGDDNCSNDV